MKNTRLLFLALLIILFGYRTTSDFSQVLEDIQENLDFGNVSTVIQIVDSLKKISSENKEIIHIADSLEQIAERITLDFSVNENKVKAQLEKLIAQVSSGQISDWENKGWLEWRMIDGEIKYFSREVG
jgi:hypothetical protein